MFDFDNMELPIVKLRVGNEVVEGKYDEEKGIVFLRDGRIARAANSKHNTNQEGTTSAREEIQNPSTGNGSQSVPVNTATQTAQTSATPSTASAAAEKNVSSAGSNIPLSSVGSDAGSDQKVAPGIQRPQTALERLEAKKRAMAEREAQKKEQLAQKGSNVSNDKKAEANRKKQEALERRNALKIEKANQKRLAKEKKLAEQIAKREKKKAAKTAGDAANYNPQKAQTKKILLAVAYVAIIVALMFGAKMFLDGQQEEVTVIRLKEDMLAGEVIRENNIEPYKMLKKSYDELGTVSYTSADGSTSVRQIIYLWEDKDEVLNKYIAVYTQGGQYLTLKNVTDKKIIRNPWLAEVGETQEIYTLPISTEGIDTRLLLPGSHLRVRVVIQQKGSSSADPFAGASSGVATPVIGENEFDKNAILENGGTVPVASVVFDDLTCVDMLNAKGESIFDIYMALSKLPVEERAQYLETTIQGDSSAFQQKVLPTSLVLVLTKPQATAMAEFENMTEATIKYTILPYKDENGNLLSSFTEIADQMSDIMQQAQQAEDMAN